MSVVRFSALLFMAAVLLAVQTSDQPADYALSTWPCGAIVWPNKVPDYAQGLVQRLTEAAETAFGYWGHDLPATAETPYRETSVLRIYDPLTDAMRVVPPLQWNDWETPPVVVIAFPNEVAMRSALGRSDLFGAIWCPSSMSQAFPDSEPWIREIGAGNRNLICPSLTTLDTLIHECAHWFTTEWCTSRGMEPDRLPNYIIEGIAEATCAEGKGPNDAVIDRLRAQAWGENNCLSGSIDGVMRYSVGESLVLYLVEALGTEAFLETLQSWTRRPLFMADLYQAEWRTSLGLPANYPD